MNKYLLFLSALACLYNIAECNDKALMCYIMSWSVYRPAEGKFDMEDIDPHLCTHIIYSYSRINSSNGHLQSLDNWADFGMGNLEKLTGLKEENPKLKIMTAVGGWDEASEKFSNMAKTEESRKNFIDSVMRYLEDNKLDGLDVDWQFPTQRGGKKKDKQNFPIFLQELRKEFEKKGYVLTARLIGQSYVTIPAYDLPKISEAVHYINLKSYEYHGTWEPRTGVFAPLLSQNEDSVEFSVNYFLEHGVPKEKLLLGISTQGNAFLIDERVSNGIYLGQKATESFKGPWVSQPGILGYNEICWELTRSRLWTQYWDKISSTPYAIHGKQFTSFENKDSLEEKLKFFKDKQLGGISVYSLDTDDFKGHCYNQKFILTNTAKTFLTSDQSPSKPMTSSEEEDNKRVVFESSVLTQEFPR